MSRAEILEHYRELPLPTTKDEAWRFTDLKGFDPDAFTVSGPGPETGPVTMMEFLVASYLTLLARAGGRSGTAALASA